MCHILRMTGSLLAGKQLSSRRTQWSGIILLWIISLEEQIAGQVGQEIFPMIYRLFFPATASWALELASGSTAKGLALHTGPGHDGPLWLLVPPGHPPLRPDNKRAGFDSTRHCPHRPFFDDVYVRH